jgi:histidinol-phosphatase (PHP family)
MDAVDRIFEETAELRRSGHPNRLETLGILKAGDKPVFEINTGAMAKGYRTSPYPAEDQIKYIQNKGGILVLSSDSHSTDTICHAFDTIEL